MLIEHADHSVTAGPIVKRGLKILFTFFLVMSAFGVGNAFAANADRQAVRQACRDDFKTYCANVQPGGGRIAACLQQNFDKLSPGCQDALKAAKGARKASPSAQ